MTRKFLSSLSVLLILTLSIFGTAAAKSKTEITGISAYETSGNILRLEISYDGELKMENISTRITGNIFSIVLNNTTPGRISRISGTRIDDSAFVKKITVKDADKNSTRIRLILANALDESACKISIQPANRAENSSAKVIVDINKEKLTTTTKKTFSTSKPAIKLSSSTRDTAVRIPAQLVPLV